MTGKTSLRAKSKIAEFSNRPQNQLNPESLLSFSQREELIAELLENQLRRRAEEQILSTPDWDLWR